jgi:polysaccharide export outer membrane protein
VRIQSWVVIGLCLTLLAACSLPRGAAIQREILAGQNDEFPEIAVYPVTRDFLPVVSAWPAIGDRPSHGWIHHSGTAGDITIKPFDTIELTVWDSEDNSLLTSETERVVDIPRLRVTESGQIFVPYIGYLRVADRTPDSARRLVEREMTAIVPSAQVQLDVAPGSSGSVSLVGGVAEPGTFPLPQANFTVLDLISLGGGPEGLRNPQVRLIRSGRTYLTSYEGLLENPARDTVLRGGDKIALIEDDRFFRALGASSTEELVYFSDESITALDALSLIGGLNERRANPRGILILREYPPETVRADLSGPQNTRTIFTVDLTSADGLFSAGKFDIYPGDTVLATESVVTTAEAVIVLFGSAVGLTRGLTN